MRPEERRGGSETRARGRGNVSSGSTQTGCLRPFWVSALRSSSSTYVTFATSTSETSRFHTTHAAKGRQCVQWTVGTLRTRTAPTDLRPLSDFPLRLTPTSLRPTPFGVPLLSNLHPPPPKSGRDPPSTPGTAGRAIPDSDPVTFGVGEEVYVTSSGSRPVRTSGTPTRREAPTGDPIPIPLSSLSLPGLGQGPRLRRDRVGGRERPWEPCCSCWGRRRSWSADAPKVPAPAGEGELAVATALLGDREVNLQVYRRTLCARLAH